MGASRKPREPVVYFHSSESMHEVATRHANLVIASPPFSQHDDGRTLVKSEYRAFIGRVLCEAERVVSDRGALVIVNTDLRDHARYSQGDTRCDGLIWHKHSDLRIVAEENGFQCIDTKIWVKSFARRVYRYNYSYVQVFRRASDRRVRQFECPQFEADVWFLPGGTIRRQPGRKPFRDAIHPVIAQRCIERFTREDDLVVSPFAGSGTVLGVATLLRRRSIGYETKRELRKLIEESVRAPEVFSAYAGLLGHRQRQRYSAADELPRTQWLQTTGEWIRQRKL
jgi:DNA modification methylase